MQSEFGETKRLESLSRRVSFIGTKYSIAGSFAKDDDTYSLHRTGVGVCSNNWNA